MNEAAMTHRPLDSSDQSHALTAQRMAVLTSAIWVVSFLLASWLLSTHLVIIREFESGTEFDAHNRIHWFRPIAFFWFDRFAIVPSGVLAALICARHLFRRSRSAATWTLAFLTALFLAIGAYTVWEQTAMMHHFVQ